MGKKSKRRERNPPTPLKPTEALNQSQRLQRALTQEPVDIATILHEAHFHGLPETVRPSCWLALLHLRQEDIREPVAQGKHREENIVSGDVARSMWSWGTHEHSTHDRARYREQLSTIINSVLSQNPENCYYQGYHDVATVLLMCTANVSQSHTMLERLSQTYLREAMRPTLEVVVQELRLLLILVQKEHRQLFAFLHRGLPDQEPFFAVSWLLTWFAHNIESPPELLRLFDFFLSSHPLMPLYFSTVLILTHAEEILQQPCDMPSIHQLVKNLYLRITADTVEGYLEFSRELFAKHRPYDLLAKRSVTAPLSKDSLLLDFPYSWMNEEHRQWLAAHHQTNERPATWLSSAIPYLIAAITLASAVYAATYYNDI